MDLGRRALCYDRLMIELSPTTEALARRLAEAEHRTVDETIRQALEARKISRAPLEGGPFSPDAVAARIARIRQIAEEVAALPDLDPRSTQDIIDDINGGI